MSSASKHTYRIKEFSALTGVSVRALHHYDRLGLLQPRHGASGYRIYGAESEPRYHIDCEAAEYVRHGMDPESARLRAQLDSVHRRYASGLHPVLVGITIHAALVLVVIVCANVAVLMLLRTVRRQKEMGIRIALGAAHRHIVRMAVITK